MSTKLDSEVIDILCCPLCKALLDVTNNGFVCRDCKSEYNKVKVSGINTEYVCDFRIHRPSYCVPLGQMRYLEAQGVYEKDHNNVISHDDPKIYSDEIDSVKEIYTREFNIEGKVLDVGGHQGRLRHYLDDSTVPLYISVDPFIFVFGGIESNSNLLNAYPCISEPCNFLSCYAENLPFSSETFDCVHMRSVLDHFQDPYLAMREAYRVLVKGGKLLIGLTVYGGQSSLRSAKDTEESLVVRIRNKLQKEGLGGLVKSIIRVIKTKEISKGEEHLFHWRYEDLVDLLKTTNFSILKEHWQKPPFAMCVYILAQK